MLPSKVATQIAERKKQQALIPKEAILPPSPGGTVRRSGRGKRSNADVVVEGEDVLQDANGKKTITAHDNEKGTNDDKDASGNEDDVDDDQADPDFEVETDPTNPKRAKKLKAKSTKPKEQTTSEAANGSEENRR
jgi:hypothetical protein